MEQERRVFSEAGMTQDNIVYAAFAVAVLLMVRRMVVFLLIQKKIPEYLKQGAIIVDVRSPGEYSAGHVKGSVNIPLSELEKRATELDLHKPILVCCASGARSGVGASLLKAKGYTQAVNAGPWNGLRQFAV